MEMSRTKKKLMLAAIMTSGLTLAISQAAMAAPEQAAQAAPQKGKAAQPCNYQINPEAQKARDKFLADTVAQRKELAEKNAVMRALLQADTPDTTKVAQVAGELFELREKLRLKAQETGLPMPMLMGFHGGDWDQMPGHGGRHHRHQGM